MNASQIMQDQIDDFLTRSGKNGADVRLKLTSFVAKIKPDFDQAVMEGDTRSLNYLRDRMVGELARTSLGAIHREKMIILEIGMTVAQTLIQTGVKAIV